MSEINKKQRIAHSKFQRSKLKKNLIFHYHTQGGQKYERENYSS